MPGKLLILRMALLLLCSEAFIPEKAVSLNLSDNTNSLFQTVGQLKQTELLTVKGKITDVADGSALPGVTIATKGTNKGTITDVNGIYTLTDISTEDVLVFSMVGYASYETPVNGRGEINVQLGQAAAALNEVVVTALGIKKEKKVLGYAVQEVTGESLVKARENNVISSLTGKVAGLTITNSTDLFQAPGISLRGRQPLIVIDGVPDQTADMWKINPDDIQSISVLKGSTASALYGSFGRNGAIMITTKRGKGNEFGVEVNSSTMFQPDFIRIPEVQTTYGNGNNGRYAYINGSGSGAEGAGWIWGPKLNQLDPNSPSGYYETPQYNSPIDPVTGKLTPLPWLSRGENNVSNFFQTGLLSTNNISISKGNEFGSFRASAAHIYQKGIVPNTELNNSSFSIAGNYILTKALTADARITYNKQFTDNYPEVGYGPTNYLYNLILWTGPDVDIRDLKNYWIPGKEGEQQRHYNQSWYNNPYFQANEYLRGYNKDNTFGVLNFNYKFSPSLSATYRTGVNVYGLARTIKEPKSYVGYSSKSRGNYYVSNDNYFDINSDLLVRYEHSFGQNFAVTAQAGGSNYYQKYSNQAVNTDGLTIPGFYSLSNSANPVQAPNSLEGNAANIIEEERRNSMYGSVDLEFFGGLYLTLTGRNDWVSTLPVKNNSFFYPSVSTSVVVSDLITMPNWLSFIKVRNSWSRVSDARFGSSPYSHIAAYERGIKWNGVPSLYYGSSNLNPEINPETSDTWETGMDLRFLKNRLGLDIAYYQVRDYNNITNVPVSLASGYSSRLENGNVYQRKGLEIVATATPLQYDDIRWNITGNFSQQRRYLKEIFGGAEELNRLKVGDRADKIFATVYETDPQGNIVYGSNGLPKLDPFTRLIGQDDPDWIYGVENALTYKNIGLHFLFDGRLGGLIYSTTNQKMWWGGTHPGTVNGFRDDANAGKSTFVGDGVVVTGGNVKYDSQGNITEDTREFAPNTRVVSYIAYMINTSNGHNANYHYYKETFLKLREVSLTYQIPSKWSTKVYIPAATVSFIGRNLFLWSKLPNVDPDPGMDNLQTPATRSLGVNLNLKF